MNVAGPPFGPDSVTWDVLRRPVFLLGGMRALLYQLAEPRVAAGVADHSDFAHRMLPRLQHTLDVVMAVGLGTEAEGRAALEKMEAVHAPVRGTTPEGVAYDAADPELRRWVLATLVDTVIEVEARWVGEWDHATRCRYYAETLRVNAAFGAAEPPNDLDDFRTWMDDTVDRMEITPTARELARHVLHPPLGWLGRRAAAVLRPVTADLLHPQLRAAYRLPLPPRSQARVARAQAISRRVLPRLPRVVRTFPLVHPVAGVRWRVGDWWRRHRPPRSGWSPG